MEDPAKARSATTSKDSLRLREILPAHEDSILGLLTLLDRMQRGSTPPCPAQKPSSAPASTANRPKTIDFSNG